MAETAPFHPILKPKFPYHLLAYPVDLIINFPHLVTPSPLPKTIHNMHVLSNQETQQPAPMPINIPSANLIQAIEKIQAPLQHKYESIKIKLITAGGPQIFLVERKRDLKLFGAKVFDDINVKGQTTQDYIKQVVKEFSLSKSMHHPNILNIYDVCRIGPMKFVGIIDYCPKSLLTLVNYSTLEPSQIVKYMEDIVGGLIYLHSEMELAHTNLNLESIMVDKNGTLKISEFSFVQSLAKKSTVDFFSNHFSLINKHQIDLERKIMRGSEPYLAPEQFDLKDSRLTKLKPEFWIKGDTWSLGVIYTQLCSNGYLPWEVAKIEDNYYRYYYESGPGFIDELVKFKGNALIASALLSIEPINRPGLDSILEALN
ncbi:kinase-like protein [Conidiobolus coronatus NRRL 28638]|uniref:Kinase-like protein n=1 Tax=Conidiobolus coronatus (strain ATCC 28846 / CBS 209.66 / NRRL 28638) TaxID=796925 RepID=A0A137P3L1_CONC2|nr:kinase-like protein [Conidiobolus coronatus NRRL 28638]|eukprot:KXN69610.1 kinase-like protein [Conidiobolus coronatus NRRL 28638]